MRPAVRQPLDHPRASAAGGSVLRYDLASDSVLWDRPLGFGVDQLAVTVDGARLYVPAGESSNSNLWHVLDAPTGSLVGTVAGGLGAHNTIARSQHVYLAGSRAPYVYLENGARIGPLAAGCRPFTVDAGETLVYTTSSRVRGFQVASVATGTVLASVSFGPVPTTFKPTAPDHGISLSPDGGEVWVLDRPTQTVRVYSAGLSPAHLADVTIRPVSGIEQPPPPTGSRRTGWLLHSRWGDYVYVGDSGSVIATATRREVAFLPALQNGRHGFLEVMFDSTGAPIDTSTHFGMGY